MYKNILMSYIINANKIIFPTDTKTNKHLNNFYNTGLAQFDYIQK